MSEFIYEGKYGEDHLISKREAGWFWKKDILQAYLSIKKFLNNTNAEEKFHATYSGL